MTPREMAGKIDHTLLRAEATPAQIDHLTDEAIEFGFIGVCVNPCFVRRVAARFAGLTQPPLVVSVAGFPLGAVLASTKEDDARRALDDGATEIDMVINLGALISGDLPTVRNEIAALAKLVHSGAVSRRLKVILETSALTRQQIADGCRCSVEGGADFVKTSTGFHAAGGATVEHVQLLRQQAPPLNVKASGGIKTAAQSLAMCAAGASRIGTSSGPAILREMVAAIQQP